MTSGIKTFPGGYLLTHYKTVIKGFLFYNPLQNTFSIVSLYNKKLNVRVVVRVAKQLQTWESIKIDCRHEKIQQPVLSLPSRNKKLAIALEDLTKSAITLYVALRKKCLYSEFFWSVFYYIPTEYRDLQSKSPYSVHMRENTD